MFHAMPYIMPYIMPPWYNKNIKLQKGNFLDDIPEVGMEPPQKFSKLFDSIHKAYKSGILPKGTKLYHTTNNYPLKLEKTDLDYDLFFGMDVSISLWYVLEHRMIQEGKNRKERLKLGIPVYDKNFLDRPAHLYEFITNEDIPYFYEPDINKDARFFPYKGLLIKPQGAYRPYWEKTYSVVIRTSELSTEAIYDPRKLTLSCIREINLTKLYRNRHKTIYEWNPCIAIGKEAEKIEIVFQDGNGRNKSDIIFCGE